MDIQTQLQQLFETRILSVPATEALQKDVAAAEAQLAAAPPMFAGEKSDEEWAALREGMDQMFASGDVLTEGLKSWQKKGQEMAEAMTIPGPGGDLSIRLFKPQGEVKGALLHTHGGGWVAGSPLQFDFNHAMAAEQCGLLVAAVDYRKAPQAPYPAAQDDCEAAALWLIDYAKNEYGIETVLIRGESAGAQLAITTAIRMKQKHQYNFAGIVAEAPLGDFSNGLPSRQSGTLIDADSVGFMTNAYLPDSSSRRNPDVSPLYYSNAELADLPPALFSCGERDGLRDDALLLFMRWIQAGNDAYMLILNGMNHNITMMEHPAAELAQQAPVAFIKRCLGGGR